MEADWGRVREGGIRKEVDGEYALWHERER